MRRCRTFILALTLALAGCAGDSDERILDFHADIEVQTDGSVLVTERIRVHATGQEIRRGIVRVFPTLYRGRFMERIPTEFELLEVQRDGRRESHRLERDFHGVEIYIGSASVFLPTGEYEYLIRYRSTRQVLHFDEHDELYWNVTGNDWAFPIERASAEVRLPAALAPLETAAFTGPRGWRGSHAQISTPEPGIVRFHTTQALARGGGLTIVVTMPKGQVSEPTPQQACAFLWQHNGALIVGFGGFALIALYYLLAWLLVGRDPPKGVIVPQYDPPPGESPWAARYLAGMSYDDPCMVADLVAAGVQGRLVLVEGDSGFSIESRDPEVALPLWQKAMVDALLPSRGDRLHFGPSARERVDKARDAHEAALRQRFQPDYFVVNRRWLGVGVVMSLLVLVGTLLVPPNFDPFSLVIGSLWAILWGVFGLGLLSAGMYMMFQGHPLLGPVVALSAALPGAAAWFGTAEFLSPQVGIEGLVLVTLLLVASTLFGLLLKRPTRQGRALMDRLEGLKLYLGMAEKADIQRLSGPEPDAERYQQMLPWAMALGVEEAWTQRFSRAVGETRALQARNEMGWIRSSTAASVGGAALGSSIGRSLGSAIASSRPSSSSGSSSGGGGSSGGGRGGGGGRGW
jgi:uncharacterized membrane protein YgcG